MTYRCKIVQSEADFSDIEMEEFHNKFISASRDCVPENRNSFVAFQANTGVEVCTFRLIVKNASSLLDDRDPVKLQAEATLGDLIRSFSSLDVVAREGDVQLLSNRERLADALRDTISCLDKFEQGVKECLQA